MIDRRHFRVLTAMSPILFPKAARRLMLGEGFDAAIAAYRIRTRRFGICSCSEKPHSSQCVAVEFSSLLAAGSLLKHDGAIFQA
jgi:hypothetical protein